jgi:hypothetical protein
MGRRQCELAGCTKGIAVVARRTARRVAGANGAKRKDAPSQQPLQVASGYCKAHGGGKRCQHAGCLTAARGDT